MTDSIACGLAVTKARISKGAIADALGISRMSLTLKINNVTEFKASEISLLKTILHLDDKERGLSTIRNYFTLKQLTKNKLEMFSLSTIRNYFTLKLAAVVLSLLLCLSTIRNYFTLKQMYSPNAYVWCLSTIRNYFTLKPIPTPPRFVICLSTIRNYFTLKL